MYVCHVCCVCVCVLVCDDICGVTEVLLQSILYCMLLLSYICHIRAGNAEQAALIAKQASVKQLLIGHYSARYTNLNVLLDEAKEVFENTILAEDGLKIRL